MYRYGRELTRLPVDRVVLQIAHRLVVRARSHANRQIRRERHRAFDGILNVLERVGLCAIVGAAAVCRVDVHRNRVVGLVGLLPSEIVKNRVPVAVKVIGGDAWIERIQAVLQVLYVGNPSPFQSLVGVGLIGESCRIVGDW